MRLTAVRQTELSCIAMLYANNTRVCMQSRMKLAVANIHTRDLCGTLLQQTIGEATRRLTHIKTSPTFDLQACGTQSTFELQSPTRNITGLGIVFQQQLCVLGQYSAILVNALPGLLAYSPIHTRSDQSLRL